jgi:HSP20 family molecular chaperone IbpA
MTQFIELEFNLSDFTRDEIDVKIEDNSISVFAETESEKNLDKDDMKGFSKSSHNFSYSSSLPPVKEDEAKIDFVDGKLKITIPKK